MRGRTFLALASLVAMACTAPQPLAPIRIAIHEPATRFTLPNGLEVVVQEDHRTPNVAVNIRYHAGAKDDPPGRAGMAHLVEHLQFTESERTKHDQFFRTMIALGARGVDGSTYADGTSYYETVPSSSLEPVLWIEADRMASARLGWSQASIDREKNVVAQELRLRYRNEPNGFRHQLFTHGIYPANHPYRRALDEEAQERASTAEELRDFAARAYGPDDATLMLVGDITVERARQLVTQYFGAVPPCTAHFASPLVAPVERAAYKRVNVIADIDEPVVYVVWPLPAPTEDGYYEARYAIANLAGLASYQTQEVHHTMRPRSVDSGVTAGRLGSIGFIYGTPTKDSKAEDLVDALDLSRTRMVAHDLGWLASFRSFYIAGEVREAEALGQRADRMQEYLETYGEADYVMTDLKNVQAVTKPRMVAAVDKLLDLDRAVVIVVTPDHDAPRAGKIMSEVPR